MQYHLLRWQQQMSNSIDFQVFMKSTLTVTESSYNLSNIYYLCLFYHPFSLYLTNTLCDITLSVIFLSLRIGCSLYASGSFEIRHIGVHCTRSKRKFLPRHMRKCVWPGHRTFHSGFSSLVFLFGFLFFWLALLRLIWTNTVNKNKALVEEFFYYI